LRDSRSIRSSGSHTAPAPLLPKGLGSLAEGTRLPACRLGSRADDALRPWCARCRARDPNAARRHRAARKDDPNRRWRKQYRTARFWPRVRPYPHRRLAMPPKCNETRERAGSCSLCTAARQELDRRDVVKLSEVRRGRSVVWGCRRRRRRRRRRR
jgi:hypothetical protein